MLRGSKGSRRSYEASFLNVLYETKLPDGEKSLAGRVSRLSVLIRETKKRINVLQKQVSSVNIRYSLSFGEIRCMSISGYHLSRAPRSHRPSARAAASSSSDDSGGSEPPQGDPDLPSFRFVRSGTLRSYLKTDRFLSSWRPVRPGLMAHVRRWAA